MDVDSGGTEKDAEDGNVLEPRGRHKRTFIDVVKEGMKLIGATEEDAEESFRWSDLIRCGDPSGGGACYQSRTRCLQDVQSQQLWLNIAVSLSLCVHEAIRVF